MPLIYLQPYVTPAAFVTELFAWGRNNSGQLGDTTIINKSSPVPVPSGSWAAVSSFGNHSLALKADGTLWAWGDNSAGQLGINNTSFRSSPVQVGTLTWRAIGTGSLHSLGIRSTLQLYAWGSNTDGQLGTGTVVNRSSPVLIGGLNWLQVAGGQFHSGAITTLGRLNMWGRNSSGQLGDNTVVNKSAPLQIGLSSWAFVGLGTEHTGAITRVGVTSITQPGDLFMWGNGSNGQLGGNDVVSKSSPVQVTGGGSWVTVHGGQNYTVGRKGNATMYSWGDNAGGQLGLNDIISRSSPTQIGTLAEWDAVVASGDHSSVGGFCLALRYDGTKWAWGRNTSGEFANGTSGNTTSSPVQIGSSLWHTYMMGFAPGSGMFVKPNETTSAGSSHSVGIRRAPSTLYGWGNAGGALGIEDATAAKRASPIQVPGGSWTVVTSGAGHTLALKPDGSLWAWGDNSTGQLGTSGNFVRYSPIQIGSSSWTAIATGGGFSLAIRAGDGALFSWGTNGGLGTGGYLGHNDIITRSSPVQVGTSSWTSIGAGYFHCGGITTDGSLFVWGFAGEGAIGDNQASFSRSSPVQIGSSLWTAVAANRKTTGAIRTDGALFMWGRGFEGQLGSNFAANRSSPVQVTGGGSWSALAVGAGNAAAIKTDGRLYTWGLNTTRGSLGHNDFISRSIPVQVGASLWTAVAIDKSQGDNSDEGHMLAIRADGTLWSWGRNVEAQLGHNNQIDRASPVQVGTLLWAQVAITNGLFGSHAIRA